MTNYRNDPMAGSIADMAPEEVAYTELAARREAEKVVSRNKNRPVYLSMLAAHLERMAKDLTTAQAPTTPATLFGEAD